MEGASQWTSRGPRRYSDLAIITVLTLRTVFHLPLRQTEGFVSSLIGLMGLALKTPDHTTLSRRSRDVEVPRFAQSGSPPHLVIDSTGLKMLGDGEWQAHKHKTSNKRRSWRKLHMGIDEDSYIVAAALTDRTVVDEYSRQCLGHRRRSQADLPGGATNAGQVDVEVWCPEAHPLRQWPRVCGPGGAIMAGKTGCANPVYRAGQSLGERLHRKL